MKLNSKSPSSYPSAQNSWRALRPSSCKFSVGCLAAMLCSLLVQPVHSATQLTCGEGYGFNDGTLGYFNLSDPERSNKIPADWLLIPDPITNSLTGEKTTPQIDPTSIRVSSVCMYATNIHHEACWENFTCKEFCYAQPDGSVKISRNAFLENDGGVDLSANGLFVTQLSLSYRLTGDPIPTKDSRVGVELRAYGYNVDYVMGYEYLYLDRNDEGDLQVTAPSDSYEFSVVPGEEVVVPNLLNVSRTATAAGSVQISKKSVSGSGWEPEVLVGGITMPVTIDVSGGPATDGPLQGSDVTFRIPKDAEAGDTVSYGLKAVVTCD